MLTLLRFVSNVTTPFCNDTLHISLSYLLTKRIFTVQKQGLAWEEHLTFFLFFSCKEPKAIYPLSFWL